MKSVLLQNIKIFAFWLTVLGFVLALILPVFDENPNETWREGFVSYLLRLWQWTCGGVLFGVLWSLPKVFQS